MCWKHVAVKCAVPRAGAASKVTRFKTFPRYLVMNLRRYILGENWTPVKLEALVRVPEELNIEHLRSYVSSCCLWSRLRVFWPVFLSDVARSDVVCCLLFVYGSEGLLPSEEALPEAAAAPVAAAAAAPVPDAEIVSAIMSMGFSENAAKRAAVGVNNSGADAAMEWVFAHNSDADFNDPLPVAAAAPAAAAASGGFQAGAPTVTSAFVQGICESASGVCVCVCACAAVADPEAVAMVCSMGFESKYAELALKETGAFPFPFPSACGFAKRLARLFVVSVHACS